MLLALSSTYVWWTLCKNNPIYISRCCVMSHRNNFDEGSSPHSQSTPNFSGNHNRPRRSIYHRSRFFSWNNILVDCIPELFRIGVFLTPNWLFNILLWHLDDNSHWGHSNKRIILQFSRVSKKTWHDVYGKPNNFYVEVIKSTGFYNKKTIIRSSDRYESWGQQAHNKTYAEHSSQRWKKTNVIIFEEDQCTQCGRTFRLYYQLRLS